jgi:ATP-dependent Clp protease protease subunit
MSKNGGGKDFFHKNRTVYFSGDFTEEKSHEIIGKLFELDADNPTKDILMYIDSYGGYIDSLVAIHDVMKYILRCDVATVCIGKSMSCGQLLLMSGAKGKRFITPNSRVLVHQVSSGTWGKVSDMENDMAEKKRLQKMIEDMIRNDTKITKKQLKKLMSVDSYIVAEDALKYGLVDHIITNPKAFYKKLNT